MMDIRRVVDTHGRLGGRDARGGAVTVRGRNEVGREASSGHRAARCVCRGCTERSGRSCRAYFDVSPLSPEWSGSLLLPRRLPKPTCASLTGATGRRVQRH